MLKIPIIAIVGKPNVGKSTLFNKIIGMRYAITSPVAGTTRDRVTHTARFKGIEVVCVDTGGLQFDVPAGDIEADVHTQAKIAIEDADLIYFVIDASAELTKSDFEAASLLRKAHKPVFLIANKCDKKEASENVYNIYELGFGETISLSALQGNGVDELENKTAHALKKLGFAHAKKRNKSTEPISICFLGRPNVGKSSLVNSLLGEERVIVSETPGTTIDTTDTAVTVQGTNFNLIDTAGLRRRGHIKKGIERFSSFRALRAIYRSDVALLILDYAESVNKQDCHVSQYVLEADKGLVIVVNKCDLMEEKAGDREAFTRVLMRKMSYAPWAPVVFVSALTKENIFAIFKIAKEIYDERRREVNHAELSTFVDHLIARKPAPSRGKRLIKITDVRQTGVNPPEFTFRVNYPQAIHFSYRRFLENELRKKYGFLGTAVRFRFRSSFGGRRI